MGTSRRRWSTVSLARSVTQLSATLCAVLIAAVFLPAAVAEQSVSASVAPTLAFTSAPTAADPGDVFDVAPTVAVTDSTDPVTLALAIDTGEPSGTLTCTDLTVTPVDGVATFEGCAIDKGGRYLLRATVGSVSTDSESLLVSGPAAVAFSTQPSGGAAAETWLGQPVATVIDGDGNVITTSTARIGLVIKPGTGTGGALVTCAETKNATEAIDGVATFTGCSVDKAGSGFRLYAIDVDDGTFGTSAAFDVNAGPAAGLRFDTPPGSGTAGAALGTQPVVSVVDAQGNRVAASTAAVRLAITSGTGATGAALTCTTNPRAATAGTASFAGCAIDRVGGAYTLTASSPELSNAVSAPLDVVAGTGSNVAFATQPSGGPGGSAFAEQPVVAVTDDGGNRVSGLVTLSIAAGTGADGATLTCDAITVPADAGLATFSGCAIDRVSQTPYVLVASLGDATARSADFDITTGGPTAVEFTTAPGDGTGGSALATQPAVALRDAGGNPAAGAVTLSLAPGFGTPGATLTCTGGATESAVGGTASFTGCRIDKAGVGYRLRAAIAGGDVFDLSSSFDVTVGDAAQLAFTAQPSGGTGGTPWSTQPSVAVHDAGGNLVTDATADVELAVAGGPGSLDCAAMPLMVASGTAHFAGCSLDRIGTGYTLVASAAGLTPATSTPFDVAVGAAHRLVFSAQPSGGVAGQTLTGQPTLTVVDAGGNPVPSSGDSVTLAITPGTGTQGATLGCANSAVNSSGSAAFGGCAVTQAGAGYALTATWKTMTAESLPFTVLRTSSPPLEIAPVGAALAQTIGGNSLAPNPTAVMNDVNTATGALHHAFTDLTVVGVGQDLVLERTYNSNDAAVGMFGRGTSTILDQSVMFNAAGTQATVRGPDGQRIVFTGHQGSFVAPPGARASLTCTGNQKTCTVTQWDGARWTVTGPRLDSYVDASGQGLTFVRESATQLRIRLATTDSKVSYDVLATLNAAGQITTVATPAGRQVTYGYTSDRLTTFTDARGKTWTYAYDSGQRLTGITDPTGATRLAATYDTSGRVATMGSKGGVQHTEDRYAYDLAAQTTTRQERTMVGGALTWATYVDTYRDNVLVRQSLPTGITLRYSYDARLNLIAIQDPNGFVQERVFNQAGDLVTQRTPLTSTQSAVISFTHDSAHRVTSQTDAQGNLTAYEYKGADLISITPPGGKGGATTFSHDLGLVREVRTPIGRQSFDRDAMGNIVRTLEFGTSGPALNGNGSRSTYDESGLETSATDARGVPATGAVDPDFTTTWSYDPTGRLLSTRSPVGVASSLTYNDAGDLVGRTDPTGATSIDWDEATLTQVTTAPGGVVTRELYDPSGHLLATASPNGGRTTHLNDALGRPVTMIDPSGQRTAITYDAMSNPVLMDDGSGVVLRQQFDAANRMVRQSSGERERLFRYDLSGHPVWIQDEDGATTQKSFDARGNISSVTDAAGSTTYTYDLADNPVKRTDGRGGVTAYTHDGMGRLTSETVDGNRTTYTNDVAGQRITTTDPEGRRTSLQLDGVGRTTRTTHTQTGRATIVIDEAYDSQGRRVSMTSDGVVSTYSYDARGNLTAAGPSNQRFTYDYATPGKVNATYPDGTDITYELDDTGALMRLDGTSSDGHVQASYLRDAERRATAISFTNGVVQSQSYDADGRVVAQSVQRAGTVMAGETYTYDDLGRRLSQRTTAAGRSVLNAYAYDALGRVSGFTSSSTTVPVPVVEARAAGALATPTTGVSPTSATSPAAPTSASATTPTTPLPVPVPGSLDTGSKQPVGTPTDPAATPAQNVVYDAVGNITRLGGTGYAVGNGDRISGQMGPAGSWTYDRSGAVTKMVGPKGVTTFDYDAAGRVTQATVQPTAGPPSTVTYTYDGDGNRVSRTTRDTTTRFVWDPNATVPLLALEMTGSTVQRRYFNDTVKPVAIQTPTETYYVHSDSLGSTNQLTDSQGDVVAAYSYTAFGEVTATGPAAAESDLLFQGQQRDPVTGLYNMRARTYDPTSGRFTQREPVATPVGIPLVAAYAFVGNRPTGYVDPTGLTSQPSAADNLQFYLNTTRPATGDAILGGYTQKGAVAGKAVSKIVLKVITPSAQASTQIVSATSKLAKESKVMSGLRSGLRAAGIGLAVAAIGLQTYVMAENCQHGSVQQCVGSAVGLATNLAFMGICLGATAGAGSIGCAVAGAVISMALEFVITAYGPAIVEGVIAAAEWVAGAAVEVGAAIESAANEVAGAIVSGFNAAGDAIASGWNSFVDTLGEAGLAAAEFGGLLASAFGFAYDEAAAALLSFGYGVQGLAEAFADVFLMDSQQAAIALREAFLVVATEVASALESVYGAAADAVAGLLQDAGYAVDEIVAGINSAYDVTVAGLVTILGELDYGYNQIASALSGVLDVTAQALGEALKSLEYTVLEIAETFQQIYDLAGVAAAEVLAAIDYAVTEVAEALQNVYAATAAAAAAVLEAAGYLVGEIATGLRDAYEVAAAQVAQILNSIAFAADQVAGALRDVYDLAAQGVAELLMGAGYIVDDIASALTSAFNETVAGVATVLRDIGYAIADITRVLDDVYAQSVEFIADLLGELDYAVEQIGAALQNVLNVTADAIIEVLNNLDYAITEIAGVLQSVYNETAQAAAALLQGAGYAIAEIGAVLQSVFQEAAAGAAAILQAIGATATQIKDVLVDAYNQTVEAIGSVLSSIGFTSDVIASIGDAFTSFGNDVAGWFEGWF